MKLAAAVTFAALCALLAACATTAPPRGEAAAPHPSDTCILLSLGKDASIGNQLAEPLRATLKAITAAPLDRPSYQCGDATYQTDPNQLGLTYLGVGFSANHRYASLSMQSVAGPLAATGYSCLYESADQSWTLRGCVVDWIT